MLDQSFSTENFRKIFDYENRKGVFLEGRYFDSLADITHQIKHQHSLIKGLKNESSLLSDQECFEKKESLNLQMEGLKKQKEKILTEHLEVLSEKVQDRSFQFSLKNGRVNSKTVYKAHHDPASYFALKQIQYNLRKLFKVKQSNRYQIICQLRELLSDKIPKFVIRTDIKSCYESIPSKKLLGFLNKGTLLSFHSKVLIKKLISEYKLLSSGDLGLPRGIGVSAYLAEIYLRELDYKIKKIPNILYYARYVDDIVVIFKKIPNENFDDQLNLIRKSFSELELTANEDKTCDFEVDGSKNHQFEYLGYKLMFGNGNVQIALANKKVQKYKAQIDLAFKLYEKQRLVNEIRARRLLEKRVKFLTGNTNLVNNKKHVRTGIYFSNSLITTSQPLKTLDTHLSQKTRLIEHERLKRRLESFSFVKGFDEKTFHTFSIQDLTLITEGWNSVS